MARVERFGIVLALRGAAAKEFRTPLHYNVTRSTPRPSYSRNYRQATKHRTLSQSVFVWAWHTGTVGYGPVAARWPVSAVHRHRRRARRRARQACSASYVWLQRWKRPWKRPLTKRVKRRRQIRWSGGCPQQQTVLCDVFQKGRVPARKRRDRSRDVQIARGSGKRQQRLDNGLREHRLLRGGEAFRMLRMLCSVRGPSLRGR